MLSAPSVTAATQTPVPARLDWLDSLRGIGAIAVLAEHMLPWVLPALRPYWFNLGVYGVLVFFLVSGYIIPASLENHGSVRAFWISRLFRLYPLYLLVVALVLVTAPWVPVREAVPRDPSTGAAHATMLLDVIGVGGLADTMWTLSYEMVFYLLATALFLANAHRRSGGLSIAFATASLCAGVLVSAPWLSGAWLAYGSCVAFIAGMACMISGRFRTAAAYGLAVMAVLLLLLSSRVPWFGAAILAVMFAGTTIRRWERGDGGLAPVILTGSLVAVCPLWAIQAGWWWVEPDVWITTMVLAGATFAGAMLLRRRRVPRLLIRLGLISYSLYLLHHPLLKLFVAVAGDLRWSALPLQAMAAIAFLTVVLCASMLTYRYVELPMQRLGRRVAVHARAVA